MPAKNQSEEDKKLIKVYHQDHQRRFLKSQANEQLLDGSVGAGKTYAGCAKVFYLCLKYPGNRIAVIRKDFTDLEESTLFTLIEGDERTDPVIPPEYIVNHNKSKHKIEVYNPWGANSTIIYSGLSKGKNAKYPQKLGSTQFGAIFIDELIEIDEGDYNFLLSRLRHPVTDRHGNPGPRPIFGATNPDGPGHWAYEQFIEPDHSDNPNIDVIQARTGDNKELRDDYLERLEERYTGMMRDRLLQGEWVMAEGRVYQNFDSELHAKPRSWFLETKEVDGKKMRDLRDYKKFIVGADAGYTNPRALLVIGVTGNDELHVLDEFYRSKTDIQDAIDWLDARKDDYSIYRVWHDPSEPADIEDLNNAGYQAEKANNDIVSGIAKTAYKIGNRYICKGCDPKQEFSSERGVQEHIDQEHGGDAEYDYHEPQLFVHPRCKHFLNEILAYKYPDEDDNKTREEKPVKENDHLMDALRYAIMGLNEGQDFSFAFG